MEPVVHPGVSDMKRFVACVATFGAAVLALPAWAAGLSLIDVPAEDGPPMAGAVWTPCAEPPGKVAIGDRSLPGAKDCPIIGRGLPLIVISHGFGGWFGGHHDTAEALADAGFIVAAIDHPDDWSHADPARKFTLTALTDRPTDIKRLIDYMLSAWPSAAKIDPSRIGFFGFSRGGFTGLALIGGAVDWQAALPALCPPDSTLPACLEARKGPLPNVQLAHDARIKAAVIADPFLGAFFTPDSLKRVAAAVQLWGSEKGGDGVQPDDAASAAHNLPAMPDYHTVPNSAHFAFLPPCTSGEEQTAPRICTDPPDFDRAAFHAQFDAEVVAFLRARLIPPSGIDP
jgi:predicted dienelactone hydrolase